MRVGGAEVQLSSLARGLDRAEFAPTVVSFHSDGELLDELRAADVPVVTVGMRGRRDLLGLLWRVAGAVRGSRPDVVYSYLDFPNAVAAALKPWMRGSRLIFGIRASDMRLAERDRVWRAIFAAERLLAGAADLIICNSWAGRAHLVACRFPEDAITVVANGIDSNCFRPDAKARRRARAELGLVETDLAVGLVARLDPMKDHQTFLRAAAELAADVPEARFVCVGDGTDQYVGELRSLGQSLGLGDKVIWTGARSDVPALLNAFDIATLSSAYGEGYPNVVGEGMAAGLPYVATDVGDAARIVGDAGIVVPTGTPSALSSAWRRLAALGPDERGRIGTAARARIVENFPPDNMVAETAAHLRRLGTRRAAQGAAREAV
jgi:glycosyltransferase involved in cell wall biosynthesis